MKAEETVTEYTGAKGLMLELEAMSAIDELGVSAQAVRPRDVGISQR